MGLGQLAELANDEPEARNGFLRELQAHRDENSTLVTRLVNELDGVITRFYGPVVIEAQTDEEVGRAAAQAALCRIWLDFLQGPVDYPAMGSPTNPTLLLLWRRYHAALALLFERDWQRWGDTEAEYRRALRNWSRALLDPNNGWLMAHLAQKEAGESEAVAWEREVRHLIWLSEKNLRRFFRERRDGKRLLDRLMRQWYLPRYDLLGAGQVLRAMLAGDLPRWLQWLYDEQKGMPWGMMGVSALLLLAGAGLSQTASHAIWGKVLVVAGFGVAIVLLLALVTTMVRLGRSALYPFAPRLAAGTMVGLLALTGLGDRVADFTFNTYCGVIPDERPYGWLAVPLLVVSLGAALVYLIADAQKALADANLARRRAVLLFVFGWAQAIVLAAFVSILAGGRLMSTHIKGLPEPCHQLHFDVGVVYPDFVLTASILGLAVGVLTQILWQEPGILDPL